MVWKKDIGSVFWWIFYVIISIIAVFSASSYVGIRLGFPAWYGLIVSILIIFAGVSLAVPLFQKKAAYYTEAEDTRGKKQVSKIFEVIAVTVVFTAGILIRILAVREALQISEPDSNFYYLNALGMVRGETVSFVHGIEQCHVWLMHECLLLFGERPASAYFFILILQMLSVWILFLAAGILCGKNPAMVCLFFLSMSQNARKQLIDLSPESLFLFFSSIGVLLAATTINAKRRLPGMAIVAGVCIGFFTYLDVCAFSLIWLLFGGIGLKKGEKTQYAGGIFCGFLGIVSGISGFAAGLSLDAILSGKDMERIELFFAAWKSVYAAEGKKVFFDGVFASGEYGMTGFAVLAILLCLGLGCVFVETNDHGRKLWTMELVSFLIPVMTGIAAAECRAEGMILFCAAMLAGLNLETIMGLKFFTKKPEKEGEQSNSIHPVWSDEEKAVEEDTAGGKKDYVKEGKQEKKDTVGKTKKITENPTGTPGKTVTVETPDGTKREVKLLDNPLKMPEKRVHKKLDFDIEVSEDDDFDH